MNNFGNINEEKLRNKKNYSSLKDKHVRDEDYEHSKKFRLYSNNKDKKIQLQLVFNTDAWLLTDVFEQLTKIYLKNGKLYLCHYFSSPRLGWNAML